MSLDVYLQKREWCTVYTANITHNLAAMAKAAGLYDYLWQPAAVGVGYARDLITPLTDGLAQLRQDPERFLALNPANDWGTYEGLMEFVSEYLQACQANPDAEVMAHG